MEEYLALKKKKELQYGMNLEDITTKWNASHRKTNNAWFRLYEASSIVNFIESTNSMVVARGYGAGAGEGGGNRDLLINRQNVSVKQDK